MKNMKRALSLVLAMVMMLGMLTIPTGAAGNFTDSDQILNGEAVAITSGMGLFAGYPDGSFNPKGTVTRAQMAVIIVKMLYGSDFDANSLRGTSKFPDVSDFEGGWAEGWINACAQLGVVAGYEDGTFRPGKEVTTAEAVTMIINALKVKPSEGTWPDNYLAKAEEMDLYGDMKVRPGMRTAINRDQLAVLAWEGLDYSSEGVQGYTVGDDAKVFATWKEATDYYKVVNNTDTVAIGAINEVKDNLAKDVFGLKTAEGFVTGNQATGEDVTLVGNGDAGDAKFNIKTGLDMIGHKVTVYYKEAYVSEKQPGTTYCVIDETTAITVNEDVTTAKEYKAAFDGARYEQANSIKYFDSAYELVPGTTTLGNSYAVGTTAPRGTYIIDEEGSIVAYIEPAAEVASYVVDVNTISGQESILISGANSGAYIPNNAEDDKIVEYTGIAAGDFVIYQQVRDVFTVTKVSSASGTLTRKDTVKVDGVNTPALTIGGTQYVKFTGANYTKSKLIINEDELVLGNDYKVYFTSDGRYIGFDEADTSVSADIVFLMGGIAVSTKDGYGNVTYTYTARGVNLNGTEVLVPLAKFDDVNGNKKYDGGTDTVLVGAVPTMPELDPEATAEQKAWGFYTIEDADGDAKKEGLKVVVPVDTTNNGGVFAVTYTGSDKTSWNGNGLLNSTDTGIKSLTQSGVTKYLFIDGTYDQDTPLIGSVLTDVAAATPTLKKYSHMLVKREADDASNEIQLVVIQANTAAGALYQSIYVTGEQLANTSRNTDGYELEAYVAATGKMTQVSLEAEQYEGLVPGFYGIRQDSEGKTEIIRYADKTADIIDGKTSADKRLCRMGMGYKGLGKGTVALFSNDAGFVPQISSVAVIDVRSEDEIAASGVDELTSFSQISSMKESNLGLIVVIDVYGYESGTSTFASVFYVTDVIRESPSFDGIVYASESPYATERTTKKMVSISSNTRETGYPVNVTYDKCEVDATGFFKYALNSAGELALTPVAMSANYGQHNTINTVDADGNVTTVNYAACECGSCTGGSERMSFKITENTRIFDADGNVITLVDVIALDKDDMVYINYYCSEGNEADLVFLYTNEGAGEYATAPGVVYVNNNGVIEAGTKALLKLHYADGNVNYPAADEQDFLLKGSASVTPATAPGKGVFYQVDENGSLTLLGINSGVVAYHNFFESYVGGTLTVSDETAPFHASGEHQYGSSYLDFTCAGEDAGILTLTNISEDLPVVGLDGVTTVTALQELVAESNGSKKPIVSYYVVDGTIKALFVEEVAEFYIPADGELIYVTGYLGVDNDGGIINNAYALSGEKAGEKIWVKYAAAGQSSDFVIKSDNAKIKDTLATYTYNGNADDTYGLYNQTGFFYVANVEGSEITLTTGTAAWFAENGFAGKLHIHRRMNVTTSIDNNGNTVLSSNVVVAAKTDSQGIHGTSSNTSNTCGTKCRATALQPNSAVNFNCASDVVVVDLRPDALRRSNPTGDSTYVEKDLESLDDMDMALTSTGGNSHVVYNTYVADDGFAHVIFIVETTTKK